MPNIKILSDSDDEAQFSDTTVILERPEQHRSEGDIPSKSFPKGIPPPVIEVNEPSDDGGCDN